jgi:hypothetical protein
MQIRGANAALSLACEQSLRIECRGDIEITCQSGLLWVTQPGDMRDLFVASHEHLRLAPSGLTLITAIAPSLVQLRELHTAARVPAWWRWASRRSAPPDAAPVLRIEPPAGQALRGMR